MRLFITFFFLCILLLQNVQQVTFKKFNILKNHLIIVKPQKNTTIVGLEFLLFLPPSDLCMFRVMIKPLCVSMMGRGHGWVTFESSIRSYSIVTLSLTFYFGNVPTLGICPTLYFWGKV